MRPTCIAVVNRVPYLRGDRARVVDRMARAVGHQVEEDFAPAWGLQPVCVGVFDDGQPVPAGAALVYLVDTIRELPGAAGRHVADPRGFFAGYVAVDSIQRMGGTMVAGSDSVSAALSHEVLELLANPCVNRWVDRGQGREVALEVCDPVAGDSYEVELEPESAGPTERVSVSNFVRPEWFHPQATSGSWFDHMRLLDAPFQRRSTGYVIERASAVEVANFGSQVVDERRRHAVQSERFARARACAPDGAPGVIGCGSDEA